MTLIRNSCNIVVFVGLTVLLASTGQGVRAADDTANALSDEEIAAGWIQLFDGETTFGWQVRAENPAEAVSVVEGALVVRGPAVVRTTTEFGPSTIRFACRYAGKGDALMALIRPEARPAALVTLDAVGETEPETWDRYELTADDEGIAGKMETRDGELLAAGEFQEKYLVAGPVRQAVGFRVGEGAVLMLRDVELKPEATTPIFNGKDLSGWKVLDGGESVYSVTEAGELNVKNGRGDIQTEGQYDDFILQLDIFSNGEHLNSGIFFRALPGQFWSGYESQIRNEYEGDDRTKPVDYGTGAIYRRVAARKVVADDFEWFTKTLIAHGNHFAVWVNGYQVTDWFDDREPADNGRNGFKAAPGVISIQGHDPTTDLSFRNLRIAELPRDE
ncbi:3-keto-disaccharide hydrolase [Tautonia marina]|uniref:3-keto-disaccharide hydrolase n=1 Tax=Tautonia marina TaxID=2653855 RepID=UPI00137562A9|nr:DUF1080 domain-containing protein [Tautonia marina]